MIAEARVANVRVNWKAFAADVQQRRLALGLSQNALVAHLQSSQRTIARAESGVKGVGVALFFRLSYWMFKQPADYLRWDQETWRNG
jgi:transcriptional regulator with XRE-family HTH domain